MGGGGVPAETWRNVCIVCISGQNRGRACARASAEECSRVRRPRRTAHRNRRVGVGAAAAAAAHRRTGTHRRPIQVRNKINHNIPRQAAAAAAAGGIVGRTGSCALCNCCQTDTESAGGRRSTCAYTHIHTHGVRLPVPERRDARRRWKNRHNITRVDSSHSPSRRGDCVGACASARACVCVVFGCKTIERVNSEWARARERVSARARTIRKTDGNDSARTGLIRQRQIHDGGPHSCAMKRQSTHKQKMLTYAENR